MIDHDACKAMTIPHVTLWVTGSDKLKKKKICKQLYIDQLYNIKLKSEFHIVKSLSLICEFLKCQIV